MKRFMYNTIPLVIALFFMYGCKKETTAGFTRVTVYPVITLKGDKTILLKKGTAFADPGVDATLNGVDATDKVVVNSTVDTSVPGKYNVSYSMVNADGFKFEDSRTVYVYDDTASPLESKFYTVATGTNRNGSPAYSGYPILVYQISPGVFSISDFFGGYYDKRAGYGSSYAMTGTFKLNGDNSLSLLTSKVAGWGDGLDALNNGVYVPATATLSFTALYAGTLNFNVILK